MSTVNRALIVDDSRVSRMMLKAIIEKNRPEWEVVEAGSPSEALAIDHASGKFEMIILDFNMPDMDGLELSTHLRCRYPEAKFALLTDNIQSCVRMNAMEKGIVFTPKPITKEKISTMMVEMNQL